MYIDYDRVEEVEKEQNQLWKLSIINREKFDYTKWQRNLFEDMTLEEINEAAAMFSKNNPL